MGRDRRAVLAAALVLALVVVLEFLPALSLTFTGDDFELLSLARIGGFDPRALVLPHRGAFVKPVLNVLWAACAALFGASPGPWYTLALLVHLLDATLLGWLGYRLARGPDPAVTTATDSGTPAPAVSEASDPAIDAETVPAALRIGRAAALTGLGAALVWAVHDRLAEPVFSVASLNHSVTFACYLGALIAAASVFTTRSARARLCVALFTLLTLFSYEVGASIVPALVLVAILAPDGRARTDRAASGNGPEGPGFARLLRRVIGRISAFGLPLGAVVLVWALVQGASRLSPAAVSYYVLDPSTWLKNIAEIGLGFLHVPSYRIEPGPLWALPFAVAVLAVALWPRIDRVARFACAWAIVATLPVLPIPFFSDRYHYIVFAGLALAVGRGVALLMSGAPRTRVMSAGLGTASPPSGTVQVENVHPWVDSAPVDAAATGTSVSRSRRVAVALVAAVLLVHVAWSIAGSREQAAYYAYKGRFSAGILSNAVRWSQDAPAVFGIAWRGEGEMFAGGLQRFEADDPPRFSERHPLYVRPQGILGIVYPADLFNVAAADRGGFYRRPAPAAAARAIAGGNLRVLVMGPSLATPREVQDLPGRLRDALLAQHQIPVTLPGEVDPGDPRRSRPAWRIAWLEPTDRAGAFEAEYGSPAVPNGTPAR